VGILAISESIVDTQRLLAAARLSEKEVGSTACNCDDDGRDTKVGDDVVVKPIVVDTSAEHNVARNKFIVMLIEMNIRRREEISSTRREKY